MTVVAAVVVSGFVALSLTPMMCSKVLKSHEPNWFYDKTEGFFEAMNSGYRKVLRATLHARWVVMLVFVGVLASMVWMFTQLKSELSPVEDRGVFMAFAVAPEGSTMQYTDNYMRQVGQILGGVPEIETLFE